MHQPTVQVKRLRGALSGLRRTAHWCIVRHMRTHYPQDPATASQIRFSITTTQGDAEALDRIADDWTQIDKDRGLVRKPWTRNTVIGQMIKKCLRIRKVR